MHIGTVNVAATEATEALMQAASMPANFMASCQDLAPEEVAAVISNLAGLARLASTLAELAANTLAEE